MSNGETGRVIKRKHVELPGGGTVDIPVITQITFKDPVDRGQETQYSIDNSAQGKRDVHVDLAPSKHSSVSTDLIGQDEAAVVFQRVQIGFVVRVSRG